jgi:hypothetical protein
MDGLSYFARCLAFLTWSCLLVKLLSSEGLWMLPIFVLSFILYMPSSYFGWPGPMG